MNTRFFAMKKLLDEVLLDQPPIMFAQRRQLAGLALHRGVPHMRRPDGDDKVEAVVLLQDRENSFLRFFRWGRQPYRWLRRPAQRVYVQLFTGVPVRELERGFRYAGCRT